jgi:SAM-dependent methyltransferase
LQKYHLCFLDFLEQKMSVVATSVAEPKFFSLHQLPLRLEPKFQSVLCDENFLMALGQYVSFDAVLEAVKRVGFAPIMSSNRMDERICFTVVPYFKPAFFDKDLIEAPEGVGGDSLWGPISAITSLYEEGTPVIWRNKEYRDKLAYWGAFAEFASDFQFPHPIVVDAMEKYPTGSLALDLGAGKGTEAIELSKRGWMVTVVEKSQEAIDVFDKICLGSPESWIMAVKRSCISEFDFPVARYHLVVAYDVLPYVSFLKIKSIFEGISKSLVPGGRFVGTFFFAKPGDSIYESRRRNGIHLLPDARIAAAMLKDVGLLIETIRYRYFSQESHPEVVEFSALKS